MKTRSIVLPLVATATLVTAFLIISGGPSGSGDVPNKYITLRLVEVQGREYWLPSEIYLKNDDFVELVFINGDEKFEHGFSVPDLNIATGGVPQGIRPR